MLVYKQKNYSTPRSLSRPSGEAWAGRGSRTASRSLRRWKGNGRRVRSATARAGKAGEARGDGGSTTGLVPRVFTPDKNQSIVEGARATYRCKRSPTRRRHRTPGSPSDSPRRLCEWTVGIARQIGVCVGEDGRAGGGGRDDGRVFARSGGARTEEEQSRGAAR